jgi:hypothetical protein
MSRRSAAASTRVAATMMNFTASAAWYSPTGRMVTPKTRSPNVWLGFSMRLEQDFEDKYLMVRQSVMLLSASVDPADPLLHYAHERDKPDDYPGAHLQICATSDAWKRVGVRTDGSQRLLERVHSPVGGRRFRPTLSFSVIKNSTMSSPAPGISVNGEP